MGRGPVITTEKLAVVDIDQAKTKLDHAHQTAALHKQQAQEQVAAKKDQHEVEIASLESEIASLKNKIAELEKKHAQELIDLQETHHDQEIKDTREIQTRELEVVKTQALVDRMGNQTGRSEHWGEGAVSGKSDNFTNND